MPEILFRLGADGKPVFNGLRRRDSPTEFMLGKTFGSGTMAPIDYMVEMAEGRIAPPANLDIATIQNQELAMSFRFHIPQYLSRRAADWNALRLHRNADRFRRVERPIEVLGRRSTVGV